MFSGSDAGPDFENSGRLLIDDEDVSLLTDSFECKEKFRMVGAPWHARLIHFVASVTQESFWHPRSCAAYRKLDTLRWINTYLAHTLRLVQQIANLRHARTEFERMRTDLLQDRAALKKDMDATKRQLWKLHEEFRAASEKGEPTCTMLSDANLLMADYQRYRELYSLYNDIINLIGKTLADSSRIEKLAFLCGTVRKSDVFANNGYKCFEETLYQLLGQVAECDRTKEYINSQLSVAKNSNLDAVFSYGFQPGREHDEKVAKAFLETGKICLDPLGSSAAKLPPKARAQESGTSPQAAV